MMRMATILPAVMLAVLHGAPAMADSAAASWPQVDLPPGAAIVDMGRQITAQGVPLRMQGFSVGDSRAVVASWFRRHLPTPLMENQVAGKLVLGQGRGDFYITVQLEDLPQGTRGVVAVSNLKALQAQRAATQAQQQRYLARLPDGTRVISQLSSTEHGVATMQLAVANSYSEDVNRDRLRALMRDDGFVLEREVPAEAPGGAASGGTLFFKGRGKDAMAVIFRDREGRVTVVLNTTQHMEQLK